jgi:hypothetical protein
MWVHWTKYTTYDLYCYFVKTSCSWVVICWTDLLTSSSQELTHSYFNTLLIGVINMRSAEYIWLHACLSAKLYTIYIRFKSLVYHNFVLCVRDNFPLLFTNFVIERGYSAIFSRVLSIRHRVSELTYLMQCFWRVCSLRKQVKIIVDYRSNSRNPSCD